VANREQDFNSVRPDGEPAADRWVTALHLFDEPDEADGLSAESEDGAVPPAEAWERAQALFEAKDFTGAARLLTGVVEQAPEQVAPRLLLARSYYHSAQLTRAEEQLRAVIERCPVEHYAYLMLGRTLERQGRREEAGRWLRAAGAFTGE
jgi:hypothetical protein